MQHRKFQANHRSNKTLSLSYIAKPTELTIDKAITRVLASKTYGILYTALNNNESLLLITSNYDHLTLLGIVALVETRHKALLELLAQNVDRVRPMRHEHGVALATSTHIFQHIKVLSHQ